jgi:hypothetical protein
MAMCVVDSSRRLLAWAPVLAFATIVGCGARAENRDTLCTEPERPHAYTEPPWLADCTEIRTNESQIDPGTGERQDHVHHFYYCCR